MFTSTAVRRLPDNPDPRAFGVEYVRALSEALGHFGIRIAVYTALDEEGILIEAVASTD